jgi:hypothetical protein
MITSGTAGTFFISPLTGLMPLVVAFNDDAGPMYCASSTSRRGWYSVSAQRRRSTGTGRGDVVTSAPSCPLPDPWILASGPGVADRISRRDPTAVRPSLS